MSSNGSPSPAVAMRHVVCVVGPRTSQPLPCSQREPVLAFSFTLSKEDSQPVPGTEKKIKLKLRLTLFLVFN